MMGSLIRDLPIVIVTSDADRAEIVKDQFRKLRNCRPLIRVLSDVDSQIDLPQSSVSNLSVDVTDGLGEAKLIELFCRFNVKRTSFFSQDCFDQVKNHCGALASHGY